MKSTTRVFVCFLAVVVLLGAVIRAVEYKFAGSAWQAKSATEKRNALWEAITYNTNSGSWHLSLPVLLGKIYDRITFESPEYDQLPYQEDSRSIRRVKVIHSVGYTCKARLVSIPGSHNYTGVFQGADNVIMRMSTATKPSEDGFGPIGPAVAVKFLRSKVPSANYVVLYKLEGQGSDVNFFSHYMTNHNPVLVPDTKLLLKLVALAFSTTTPYFYAVGLSDLARYDQEGTEYHPNMPYQIKMVPNEALSNRKITPELKNLHTQMQHTDPDTYPILYHLYAQKEPFDPFVHIGDFYLESTPTSSFFGDEHLYFHHQYMDEDFKYRPDWEHQFQQDTIADYRKNSTCFWDKLAFSKFIIPKKYPQNLLRNILCPIYW